VGTDGRRWKRDFGGAVNVGWFDAIGAQKVQAAFLCGHPIVDGGGLTYELSSGLTVPQSLKVFKNAVLDFRPAPSNAILMAAQTNYSTESALTSDAVYGATQIQVVSTSGLVAGDWVFLSSSGVWSNDGAETVTRGESIKIRALLPNNFIEFETPIDDTYTVSDLARVRLFRGHAKLRFENITGIGKGDLESQVALDASRVQGLDVLGCDFSNFGYAGLRIRGCTDVFIGSATKITGSNLDALGYNIELLGPNNGVLVEGCHLSNGRVGATQGGTEGVGRNIVYFGNHCSGHYTGSLGTKGAAASVAYVGNILEGSNEAIGLGDGIRARGRDVVVTGNIAKGFKRFPIMVSLNGSKGSRPCSANIGTNLIEQARDCAVQVVIEGEIGRAHV
jgi:hypothetical protein